MKSDRVIFQPPRRSRARGGGAALSLIELLVVIAIISILAALLMPTLGRSKGAAQAVACLNNNRQLILAVQNYTGENREFFPPNPDDGNTVPGHNWCAGSAGPGNAQEFNHELLADPERTLVSPYLGRSSGAFRCPADRRSGASPSGQTVSAARSFSMNQAFGTVCPGFDLGGAHDGSPTLPTHGPLLNSPNPNTRLGPWRTFGKTSSLSGGPGAARLWLLADEDYRSLNDAAFSFSMATATWLDRPGTAHNLGGTFSFADGHSEIHQWLDPSTRVAGSALQRGSRISGEKRDWLWMRERTSAHRSGTMPPPQ
ncbi:MAG: type II secretion system protein [Akkermansiaceae bacterium]|nr:type II secretion system protein [Verrucomicrobiales bacterium]